MTTVIPNHAHCRICGRAVPFGDETCSNACKGKIDDLQKRKRNMMYFLYAMIGFSLILLVLQITRGA